MYSTYLFDFDYTLGDATDGIVDSVNFAMNKMNISSFPKEEIRKTIGMHLSNTYTYLSKDSNEDNRTLFQELFRQRADIVMLDNTKLFEDTEMVLRKLKEDNAKIAIVTTKFRYRIVDILKKYQIENLIDVVIGGEDVKKHKPDPEAAEIAIEKINADRRNCLYIGDSVIDAETALNAKVDFIGVTTGTTPKEDLERYPNIKVISRLKELLDCIK